ncbi:hypothetical protein D7I39_20590 [Allopusillimonas ginsengisoli]|nr:hypothetical protein D7I39_20590 [Allopusillimonas ginsengisoli]
MNKSRAHLALFAMVASMSLVVACSKEDDTPPPADSGMTTPAPQAAPGTAPEPSGTTPEPSPAPGTSAQ